MNVCISSHIQSSTVSSTRDDTDDVGRIDEAATAATAAPEPRGIGGGWSRRLLRYGLVIVAYSIIMGAIFYQLLEENKLDMIIRKKTPDVFLRGHSQL